MRLKSSMDAIDDLDNILVRISHICEYSHLLKKE